MTITSALFLALAQAPYDLGFIAVVALVPWMIATRGAHAIEAGVLGIVLGVTYGLASAFWLISAFEGQGAIGFRSVLAALLTVLWGKSILFAGIGIACWRIRGWPLLAQIVVLATLFGLGQYWMSESRWGLPVVLVGHSQLSTTGVAQLAVVGGVPLISGFLFAINWALAQRVSGIRSATSLCAGLVAAWLAAALLGIPLVNSLRPPPSDDVKRFLAVQPHISRDHRWKPEYQNVILDEIAAYTTQALKAAVEPPDAILWPENLLTTPLSRNNRLERQLQAHIDGWGTPVISGLVRSSGNSRDRHYRNSVVWLSPNIGERDSIDKERAMPLVESSRDFPGRRLLTLIVGGAAGGPQVAEAATAGSLKGEFIVSPALCFEVLFPGVVASRRDEASSAIVNLADDSWVAGEVADAQLISAAAFRAIEQRITLIRVAHGGLSVVIDPLGRQVMSLPPDQYAHMFVEVAATAPPTIAERAGVFALPIVVGLATWALAVRRSKRS